MLTWHNETIKYTQRQTIIAEQSHSEYTLAFSRLHHVFASVTITFLHDLIHAEPRRTTDRRCGVLDLLYWSCNVLLVLSNVCIIAQ